MSTTLHVRGRHIGTLQEIAGVFSLLDSDLIRISYNFQESSEIGVPFGETPWEGLGKSSWSGHEASLFMQFS